VLFKGKNKGRHSLTRHNLTRQSKCSKVHARGATDPWLIATSLPRTKSLGKKIVAIYRLRMQIEEEFRDIKSSLFGLGFEHHKSRCVHRIAVLILIATLASILANIIVWQSSWAVCTIVIKQTQLRLDEYYRFTI
jgi:transposase